MGVVALLVVLGYLYLYPASAHLFAGRGDWLLSNGGDHTPLPTLYDMVSEEARERPRRLLYGAVYTERLNPPHGFALLFPWIERWVVAIADRFSPIEAVPTAVVWFFMVLNGACFYLFGRVEGWRRTVALALAIAFAFNVYTRARAAVHAGLVALYLLPLLFVGLRLLQRGATRRNLVSAAGLFLLCAMAPAYYVVMGIALLPLLLWFYFRGLPEGRRPLGAFGTLAATAAPAVLFLAWNVAAPVPSAYRDRDAVHLPAVLRNFLYEFSARPSDYLVGDISLVEPGAGAREPRDWNPLRRAVNAYARANVAPSNLHERSNGIRWVLLVPFIAFLFAWAVPRFRRRLDPELRREGSFFAVLAIWAFFFSLSPAAIRLETDLGPALWLHKLVPNFRVPARFGAFVHFAVLALVGHAAETWLRRIDSGRGRRLTFALAAALPVVVVLDHPPLQPVPVVRLSPTLKPVEEASADGHCGIGLFFPYVAANPQFEDEAEFYRALQRLRRTDCVAINSTVPTPTSESLRARLGRRAHKRDPATEARLLELIRCARLDWIVFSSQVPPAQRDRICGALGWIRVAPDACRAQVSRGDFVDPGRCLSP